MRRLAEQRAFRQRLWKVVRWDEELRVAEVLDRADSDDHLLAGAFGALDLPIKVRWIEHIGRRLHPGPERREADHLEGMLEQRRQGRARVQSEALRLERAEADANASRAAPFHWNGAPASGQRPFSSSDLEAHGDQTVYWRGASPR